MVLALGNQAVLAHGGWETTALAWDQEVLACGDWVVLALEDQVVLADGGWETMACGNWAVLAHVG